MNNKFKVISQEDFAVLSTEQQARFIDMTQKLTEAAIERMKFELDQDGIAYSKTDIKEVRNKYDQLTKFVNEEYAQEMNFLETNGFDETISEMAARKGFLLIDIESDIGKMGQAEFYENIRSVFFSQSQHSLKLETEFLDTFKPETFYIPNSKVANSLTKPQVTFEIGDFDVEISKKQDVSVQVTLSFDDKNIQIIERNGNRLIAFDRSVLDAVCSRFQAGNNTFTPDQIHRTINGLTEGEFVSNESRMRIVKSIDKMRFLEVKIDYTDEAIKMYKKASHQNNEPKKYIMSGYLLPANKAELTTSIGNVQGYRVLEKPIIYAYSQHNNQIISVPIELLNGKGYLNNTPEVIVTRQYLIRRIAVMKTDSKQSNRILLEKVYLELDLENPTKEKAKKIRGSIEKILTKFKDEKFIKGFEFCKKGRSFHGVDIWY